MKQDSIGSTTNRRVVRAALAGLVGAFVIAGAVLMFKGMFAIFAPGSCGNRPTSECAFEQELALHVGRRQTLIGGALLLLALAIIAWVRSSVRSKD